MSVVDLRGAGGSPGLRLGDIDGDGRLEIVVAQPVDQSTLGPYTATSNSSGAYTVTVAAARNVTVTYTINATDAAGNTGANRTLTFTARN